MWEVLVVLTHLKHISQFGNLPPVSVKIEHVWNHHLESFMASLYFTVTLQGKKPYPPQGKLQMRGVVHIPWDLCHQELFLKVKASAFPACWILLEKMTILRPWVENPVCMCAGAYTVGHLPLSIQGRRLLLKLLLMITTYNMIVLITSIIMRAMMLIQNSFSDTRICQDNCHSSHHHEISRSK